MAKPHIFVSSTYVDLKEVRATLENFISQYGFEAILFEKGGLPFDYDKELDKSCYDEVARSDMYILIIGGRYGSPSSADKEVIRKKMKTYNSITRKEYETAIAANIPIHVFIDSKVVAEFETYKNNKGKDVHYVHVDNENIFELIQDIYSKKGNNLVKEFAVASDISNWLRKQWAGFFKIYLETKRKTLEEDKAQKVRINCYKLFYHRHRLKFSIHKLAKNADIHPQLLVKMEIPCKKHNHGDKMFPLSKMIDIQKVCLALEINQKELLLGHVDDHSYQYIDYYLRYKRKKITKRHHDQLVLTPVKVVVFDFDGTLTKPKDNLTTWEKIWVKTGHTVNDCARYHSEYTGGKITHSEWCKITLEAFSKNGFSKEIAKEIATDIELVDDVKDVIYFLQDKGVIVHLLSGSIDIIIENVLNDLRSCFSSIQSNQMRFDRSGKLIEIIGTQYDFKGKAEYLKKLLERHNVHSSEVLYVGNSGNDRWAYLSGVRTLCVNPAFTDPDNHIEWTHKLRQMKSLKEILPYIYHATSEYDAML